MKKKSNIHNGFRILVLLIAVVVMLSAMQLNLFATGIDTEELQNDNTETTQIEEINTTPLVEEDTEFYEVTEYREEYAKHFHLSDGTYRAITYASPIHRKDASGNWQDIDNRLFPNTTAKGTATYTTSDGRMSFAQSSTDFATSGIYTLSENGYTVSLSALGQSKNADMSMNATSNTELVLGVAASVDNHSLPAAALESDSDDVKFEKATKIDNRSSLVYENVFSNTDLEYVLSANSVKENIIVKSPRANYSYTFVFSTDGLVATLDESGQILLTDSESEELVYYIPAPYMYDAGGETSYAVTYELIEIKAGQYLLTVSADSAWINAQDRAFPVVIDPTIESSRTTFDLFVSSEHPDDWYGSETYMKVSNTDITLIRVALPTIPSDSIITNAELHAYYYYEENVQGYFLIEVYQYLYAWPELVSSWNSLNEFPNMGMSQTMITDNMLIYYEDTFGEPPTETFFNLTDLVRDWYDGTHPNYGVALKRANETYTVDAAYFVSSAAHQSNVHTPYYVISYEPTEFEDGIIHTIKNTASDKLMMPLNANNNSPITIDTFSSDNTSMMWKFEHVGYGYYKIKNDVTGYYLYAPSNNLENSRVIQCPITDSTIDRALWRFVKTSDGYYKIQSKNQAKRDTDTFLYLSVNGTYVVQSSTGTNATWIMQPLILNINVLYDQAFVDRFGINYMELLESVYGENSVGLSIPSVFKERFGISVKVNFSSTAYESYPYRNDCIHKNSVDDICHDCKNAGEYAEVIECSMGLHHKNELKLLGTLESMSLIESTSTNVLYSGYKCCYTNLREENHDGDLTSFYHQNSPRANAWGSVGGNRILIEAYTRREDLSSTAANKFDNIIRTTVHELLHTLGLQHCNEDSVCLLVKQTTPVTSNLIMCNTCLNLANTYKLKLYNHQEGGNV